MTSWEERMAARAAQRRRADEKMQQELEEAAWQAEAQRAARECLEEFKAGPPDGCYQCYEWGPRIITHGSAWWHGASVQPGPPPEREYPPGGVPGDYQQKDTDWCYHACHGDDAPVYCGPVWYG